MDQVKHLKKKGMAIYLVYSHLAFTLPGQSMDATLAKPGQELQSLPVMKPGNGELCVCKQLQNKYDIIVYAVLR